MNEQTKNLYDECKRLEESCLYTSTSFFIWLRVLRTLKLLMVAASLVLGALASFKLLTDSGHTALVAVFALLAGLLPTIQEAIGLDGAIKETKELSGEFKNLQDLFRRAAGVSAHKPFAEFESDVNALTTRLEKARAASITPPEFIFWLARRKVRTGHYTFDFDEAAK